MKARLLAAAAALAVAAPAAGQPAHEAPAQAAGAGAGIAATALRTRITPDIAAPLSLGTTVARAGRVYTIDGGTRAGANLFHSFASFDLAAGDTARWTYSAGDPAAIRNVLSRVTGGEPSSIFGRIDSSALPHADFWFVNPAGILFGQGTRIDVPATAHFSTAQELRFDTGPAFAVTTPGGSSFSMASPAAFGFLGGQGAIAVQGADRNLLPEGGRLSLVGGDVTVADSDVAGGRIELIAAGSGAAAVSVADPLSSAPAGNLKLDTSVLRLNGHPGDGRGLLIGGGKVEISSSDLGTAFTSGPDQGVSAPIDISGGDVTIFSALVSSATRGAEPAGNILISGRTVRITANSVVSSNALFGSTGTAGMVAITGGDIRIDDRAFVSSSTQTAQRGGSVVLQGGRIAISRANVASEALPQATGDAGSILVSGTSLLVDDGGSIGSATDGRGNAGAISIGIDGPATLSLGSIETEARSDIGNAGTIAIAATSLDLSDQSRISSTTFGSGAGGRIDVRGDTLALDGSTISTSSEPDATGRPGSIGIDVTGLDLVHGSRIATEADNPGPAGTIRIGADSIAIAGVGSSISSANFFESGGDAGTATINVRALSLIEGGSITTSATGGAAGDILILMPRDGLLRLTGRSVGSLITTSSGPGTGGRILISDPRAIVSDGGSILALGQQGGANVQIQTGFFIDSADRPNRVAVNGSFLLEAQAGDVSSGTTERDLSILDASGVLRGQCAAARATGRVSQLVIRPTGPYPPGGSCR